MEVFSSTQNPAQVQHCVGVALNRSQHKITVSNNVSAILCFGGMLLAILRIWNTVKQSFDVIIL